VQNATVLYMWLKTDTRSGIREYGN